MKPYLWIWPMVFLGLPTLLLAGEADVLKVDVRKSGENIYHFSVTVQHADTGWQHYADKWDIIGTDGAIYGTRTLYHPHVNEQPFTRSLPGVTIPAGVRKVTVRAHDSVHKYGGKVMEIVLP